MRVVHIGTMPLEKMGIVTRLLVDQLGHEYVTLYEWEDSPELHADIVVLHCFKKEADWFISYERRADERVVSLIHSTSPCAPAYCSDAVVALTDASMNEVLTDGLNFKRAYVIPAGIDASFPVITLDHYWRFGKIFGCITRNAPGKLASDWNELAYSFLEQCPEYMGYMFVDKVDNLLVHGRMVYDTSLTLQTPLVKKIDALSKLGVGLFAHGFFQETFCVAILECMAAGVPIVYTYQPAIREVVGDSQYCCHSAEDAFKVTAAILEDASLRRAVGEAAQQRAAKFKASRMIDEWTSLLNEVTK